MKTKRYHTMQEVKDDLKILKLRRDISLAKLEGSKLEIASSLQTVKILASVMKVLKNYGLAYLIRKLLK